MTQLMKRSHTAASGSLFPDAHGVVVGYDELGWIGRHLNFDSFSITWPKTVFFFFL